jgi:hypothetical protein
LNIYFPKNGRAPIIEDVKKVEALRFGSAGAEECGRQGDEPGEGGEFGKSLDILFFMVYTHGEVPPLVGLLLSDKHIIQ